MEPLYVCCAVPKKKPRTKRDKQGDRRCVPCCVVTCCVDTTTMCGGGVCVCFFGIFSLLCSGFRMASGTQQTHRTHTHMQHSLSQDTITPPNWRVPRFISCWKINHVCWGLCFSFAGQSSTSNPTEPKHSTQRGAKRNKIPPNIKRPSRSACEPLSQTLASQTLSFLLGSGAKPMSLRHAASDSTDCA